VAKTHPQVRSPVLVHEDAVREFCRLARRGYETRGKQEMFGFLFGRRTPEGHLLVRHVRYYRGGTRTMYGISLPLTESRRRRRKLARDLNLRFLGSFHSHVEIAGRITRGMSDVDRESFRSDPAAPLEAVVFIWAGLKRTLRTNPLSVVGYEPSTGYHYRVRFYAKFANGIRRTRVRVHRSGIVIVY